MEILLFIKLGWWRKVFYSMKKSTITSYFHCVQKCQHCNIFSIRKQNLDVKTAFLNINLDEKIFMKISKRLNYDENKVLKLKKSLYKLKE